MADVVVHHLDRSRSTRVLWLLEELEVPYRMEVHRRDAGMRAPAALREVHPLGKSPVVVVDGEVLAESGAILEELLDRFDPDHRLRPRPGTPEHRRFRYFLHYAEGSLMPPLLVKLIFTRVETGPLPFFVKPIAKGIASKVNALFTHPEIDRHLAFLEGALADRPWFAGEAFTAADIQLSYPLEAGLARLGLGPDRTPRLHDFLARIHARPAYRRAVDKGGPTT